jgi:hypothetical protein
VDAVVFERVSPSKFPANREKNREFCKIVTSGALETANNGVGTGLLMRIPYLTKQGIIFVGTRNLGATAGNLLEGNYRWRECYCKQNSLLVGQSNPAYLGVGFAVQTTSSLPTGAPGARVFGTASASVSAFTVAIRGKADMPFCTAYVRL